MSLSVGRYMDTQIKREIWLLALGTIFRPLHHERRPIRRRDEVAELPHANGIQSRAATEIDEAALRAERCIEPAPHLRAHILDEIVVAARPVVVGGDTVECDLSFT